MTDQPTPGSASPAPDAPDPTPQPPQQPPPLAPLVTQEAGWAAMGEPPAPGGEQPAQGGGGQPLPTGEQPVPPSAAPPPAPAASRGDKIRMGLILGGIVAFLAVVLFMTMNNQSAFDLEVGQCFDLPSQTTDIDTVTKRECTAAHDAEVFFVADHPEAAAYPGEPSFDAFVDTNCKPAFGTYVGRSFEEAEELTYGWFYPTPESWDEADDREVTCYVVNSDESKLTQSVKAGS